MSNKTPVAKSAKTELAPKKPRRFLSATFLATVFILISVVALVASQYEYGRSRETLKFGDRTLFIEEVATNESRQRGLGGREAIDDDFGMLFVFENKGKHCFWMKDMNFPIDILWLDDNYRVVDMERSASPDTYPRNFCPDTQARYVLEVQGGLSATKNIAIGSKL